MSTEPSGGHPPRASPRRLFGHNLDRIAALAQEIERGAADQRTLRRPRQQQLELPSPAANRHRGAAQDRLARLVGVVGRDVELARPSQQAPLHGEVDDHHLAVQRGPEARRVWIGGVADAPQSPSTAPKERFRVAA